MFIDEDLPAFAREWIAYLKAKNHRIVRTWLARQVLISRDAKGDDYRWLLLYTRRPICRLTAIEHRHIQDHLRTARQYRQQAYVVVLFDLPVRKVLALSAHKALRRRRLSANRAGIFWAPPEPQVGDDA